MGDDTFNSALVLRLSRFSIQDFESGMENLWKDEIFRTAVKIAFRHAETLFASFEDFNTLPENWQFTFWKYANRMCHRSTPFGLFTGMSVWSWKEENKLNIEPSGFQKICLSQKLISVPVAPYWNRLVYRIGENSRYYLQDESSVAHPWSLKEVESFDFDPIDKMGQQEVQVLKDCGLLQEEVLENHFEECSLETQDTDECINHGKYALKGALNSQIQDSLLKAKEVLDRLSLPLIPQALQSFKKEFQSRFEYHAVPVLQALDPDFGISYPLNCPIKREVSWSEIHSCLLNHYTKSIKTEKDLVINLKDIPVLSGKKETADKYGQTIMFSLSDAGIVWMHQSYGTIPLLARMSPCDPDLSGLCAEFVAKETKSDVIHADLIYQGEEVMKAVSPPLAFRKFQIVISPVKWKFNEVLELNDLLLMMHHGELILYSLKYLKRVIPHLNSAYNPRRDEFPLFRLMMDLQLEGQNLTADFQLEDFLPGLNFYPRVNVGDVILQPATWVLYEKELNVFRQRMDFKDRRIWFNQIARWIGIPDRFLWKQGDHGLVFNRENEFALKVFFKCISHLSKITLQECLALDLAKLSDKRGRKYAHEFLAFYHPKKILRPGIPSVPIIWNNKTPDSRWRTLRVYVQPDQQDRFLLEFIWPLFIHKKDSLFACWFFIRYIDSLGPHLRIRFKSRTRVLEPAFCKMLMGLQNKWMKGAYVQNVTVHSYFPEEQRYACLGMIRTHRLFEKSSIEMVRRNLAKDNDDRLLYILLFLLLLDRELERLTLGQLSMELNSFQKPANPEWWNQWFRSHREHLMEQLDMVRRSDEVLNYLHQKSYSGKSVQEVKDYFGSIFHMQVNRLSDQDQTAKELACFYLLPKLKTFFNAKSL